MASSENTLRSLTTTDESKLVPPLCKRHSASSHSHASKSMGVTYHGWRHASKDFMSWAHKLSKKHQHTWRKAGIFEAIMASTKKIHKNQSLILAVAEKWCPRTNTFVFPWGEATLTLEDVMVLLGFSVLGLPYFASLESTEEKRTEKKLESVCVQIKEEKGFNANQVTWVSRFMDTGHELEHVAFLALWLSYFVFPTRYYHIDEAVFPIAVNLSSGRRIALAPAVLSQLYAELSLLRNHIRAVNESTIPLKIDLCALFKLVQVWTWERFRELQPPNPMLKGDPRLALWHDLERKTRKTKKARNVTEVLENSILDSFEWRPYTTHVENWKFPQFYPEKAMWVPVDTTNIDDELLSYARCIRVSELVGIDCVEHYFPNRVASQFGMVQKFTCPVNKNHLSQEEAWRNYDKPIDDLVLYIPSRFTTTQAAPRISKILQLQWSSMEKQVVESYETLTPGGDGTSFVHPGAEMGGTSKDGAEESMNKKRPREDDENSMIRVETQVPSDNDDEEADRLTNSQWLKRISNKKYIYVKRSRRDASKRSGLEGDDNNYSGSCHNLASIRDETVPLQEIEQRNEDGDETGQNAGRKLVLSLSDGNKFSSPRLDIAVSPPETMQSCDDELDVHGNNADENTTIADDSMEPDYLLHESDGAIAGDDGDKTETNESRSKAAEISIHIPYDENKSSDPLLASEAASEDIRTKAHKSVYTHLNVGDQTQDQDCLPQDNGLGSEETKKPKEQLEDLGKSNGGGGIGNDSVKQSLLNIEEMAKDIEERIMKAQKNVAWLKARKAMKQRNITSARLGR